MSNLEPDLGESTSVIDRLRQAAFTPTITPTAPATVQASTASDTAAFNPLAPRLPDELQAKVDGLASGTIATPTEPVDTSGLDTSAIITNLPNARKAFVSKYTRLKNAVVALPEPVRKALIDMDLERANKGQSPMNDQETLASILTIMRNEPATKEPKDRSVLQQVLSIPGNAVEDAGNILKSVPSMLVPNRGNVFYKELVAGGKALSEAVTGGTTTSSMYEKQRQAGMNPVEAFAALPVVRLVPGSFLVSNLSRGTEGLSNMAEHPVGTVLDVLPYAGKIAEGTKAGQIALAEKEAGIASTSPLRAVLNRKILPEGETTIRGSQLAPARLGKVADSFSRTSLGEWVTQAFGEESRKASRTMNLYDAQFVEALQGKRPLTLPDQQFARKSFGLAAEDLHKKFNIPPERVKAVTAALETDRNIIFSTDAFSDAERAMAARAIRLEKQAEDLNIGAGNVMRIYDEVYDVSTGKAIRKAQEKVGKKAALVDEGLFARVVKARNEIINKEGPLSTVDRHVLEKLDPLHDLLGDYFTNPNTTVTLKDLDKASRGIAMQRTRLGGAGQVGEKVAPKGDIRLDTLAKIRGEIKDAAKAEKKLQETLDRAPARWMPNIQLLAKDKAHEYLVGKGVDPLEATRMIVERDFSIAPDIYSRKVWEKIVAGTEPMWRELKAAGIDPLFVHRVPISKQRILSLPRLTDYVTPITQAKARNIFDATPYTQDVTVALAHQGAELVSNALSREALDSIGRELGFKEGVLRERVMPVARRRVEGTAHDVNDAAVQILSKDFVPFSPEGKKFGANLPRFLDDPERIWIPKAVAKTLDRYYHPNPSELFGAVRAINGVFRTSVLPFSVRWQINNNIGGAIITAITNPGAFTEIFRARKVIKAWKEGVEGVIPEEIGYGFGSVRKEIAESKYATASYMHGEKLGSLWQQIQESKVKQAGSAAAQKMYDINSWSDETFKVMTYLNTEKKALRAGATKAAAMEEGLQAVNRYFQNWNSLTPIERQVLREVFPFYAFTSYVMKFIMQFPGTHPLRTAIMSNMAEAEIADMNATFPQEMLDYLALDSAPDENGDQRFLSLRGLNPFADTANSFTLEGFLSGLNPIGQAIIKSRGGDLGYGVGAGQPTYDKETGRLTEAKPGFIESLVDSTVPQVGFLRRIAGRDPEYNALLRTNPEAAQRLLVSGIGIPASGRTINIPEMQIKGELSRLQVQAAVMKRARETGDYSEAMKWPALRPQIAQLQRLNALGLLAEYNPPAGASNSLVDAIGSVKPWPT